MASRIFNDLAKGLRERKGQSERKGSFLPVSVAAFSLGENE